MDDAILHDPRAGSEWIMRGGFEMNLKYWEDRTFSIENIWYYIGQKVNNIWKILLNENDCNLKIKILKVKINLKSILMIISKHSL